MRELSKIEDVGKFTVRNRKREQVIFWMLVVFMHPCNTTDVLLMAEPAFCKSKSVPLSHSSRNLVCRHRAQILLTAVGAIKESVFGKGNVQKLR